MANPRFELDPSYPASKCYRTDTGWFWKIDVVRGTFGKFFLTDGAGLVGSSNAVFIVPNSSAGFIGQTGQQARRPVEIYGLTKGICFVEFRAPGSPAVVVYMQVEVTELPGDRPSFVKPSGPTAVFIGPGLPRQYQFTSMWTVGSGPPENLFDQTPLGTTHVVISTHGQMSASGINMSIAGGVTRSNCSAVFAKLKSKVTRPGGSAVEGVVWISGCDAGSDNDFCKSAAQASGFYIVAAAIVVPVVRIPAGMIDYFERSMIKFFDNDKGDPMKASDFLLKQKELQFSIVPG
jgi:hypothetical protein